MLYEACLKKEKTYWWDEDAWGICMFSAHSDEEARKFIATVVQRMNRVYWRMGEPRNISISRLSQLEEEGFSIMRREAYLQCIVPFQKFQDIRRVLEAFYPKVHGRARHFSIISSFSLWKPVPHFH